MTIDSMAGRLRICRLRAVGHIVLSDIAPKTLKALIAIHGGERVEDF
jgi:hypothetical protein